MQKNGLENYTLKYVGCSHYFKKSFNLKWYKKYEVLVYTHLSGHFAKSIKTC